MDPKIVTPIALLIDDGVHIFESVTEAERSFELQDIKPFWVGYDSVGQALRIEVVKDDRPWGGKRVNIRVDHDLLIYFFTSPEFRERAESFLWARKPEFTEADCARMSVAELLEHLFDFNGPKEP